MRSLVSTLLVVATLAVTASAVASVRDTGPVVAWKTAKFGKILATKGHLALYTWKQEADKKVERCRSVCAPWCWTSLAPALDSRLGRIS